MVNRGRSCACVAIVVAVLTEPALGVVNSWGGSLNNNWGSTANWSQKAIPTTSHDVVFAAGGLNLSTTLGANRDMLNLTISSPSSVAIAGPYELASYGASISITAGAHSIATNKLRLAANNKTWNISANCSLTVSTQVTHGATALSITKTGAGTLILDNATNSFSGGLTVTQGMTSIATDVAASGNSAIGAGALTLNGGALRYNGASAASFARGFTLTQNGGGFDASGAGAIAVSGGAITHSGTGARTLSLAGTSLAANTFFPVIANQSGNATSVNKTGSGTWVLMGDNTYTGSTTINGGSLLVNGSLAGTATTINSGGALGGTGTLAGSVDANSGGTVSPGETESTPAELTVGSLTLDTGSIYEVGISDATSTQGVGWDLLTSTGLTTHGSFTVKLTSYSGIGGGAGAPIGLPLGNGEVSEWLIASTASGAFDKSTIGLDTSGFQPRPETLAGYTFSLLTKPEESHRNLYISYSYSTVPEASTVLLAALGLAPLALHRRRKHT